MFQGENISVPLDIFTGPHIFWGNSFFKKLPKRFFFFNLKIKIKKVTSKSEREWQQDGRKMQTSPQAQRPVKGAASGRDRVTDDQLCANKQQYPPPSKKDLAARFVSAKGTKREGRPSETRQGRPPHQKS
jgi:hypothetical protein